MILLEKYLNDPIPGVRVWVALDLLPISPQKAIEVLEEIANGSYGVAKMDASDILNEWKKGELTFPYMN